MRWSTARGTRRRGSKWIAGLVIIGAAVLAESRLFDSHARAETRSWVDDSRTPPKRAAKPSDASRAPRPARPAPVSGVVLKITPEETRDQVAISAATLFNTGNVSQRKLGQLIEQGGTGELPPAAATRDAFADAMVNALFGLKLTSDEVKQMSHAIAVFADADELSPEEIKTARANLAAALTAAEGAPQRNEKVLATFDRSMTEQTNESRRSLKANLSAAQKASVVTPELIEKIKTDLVGVAQGATKPGDPALRSLAVNLADVMRDGSMSSKERAQLVHNLAEAIGRDDLGEYQAKALVSSVRSIVEASNVSKADVQKVVGDLETIREQVQPLAQSPASNAPATTQPTAAVPVP